LVKARFENDSPQEAENVQLLSSVSSVLTFWTTHTAKVVSGGENSYRVQNLEVLLFVNNKSN